VVDAGAGQSLEVPWAFFDWHAAPWFGLPSHTPVHGEPAEPEHAAPPTDTAQIGHGWVGTPVRTVAELSSKSHVAAPLVLSSVPVGGDENVLTPLDAERFRVGALPEWVRLDTIVEGKALRMNYSGADYHRDFTP
jgi:hypothetical protein